MANSADLDQLAFQRPTDMDLHCLQRQGISGFSRTRVKVLIRIILVNSQQIVEQLSGNPS